MNITVVIRTTAPDIAAAQGIFDSILAKLQTVPGLNVTGQLNEELVKPGPPDPV